MTHMLLNVFGGLAIFIFGMKLMSLGLHRVAGERMRSVLRLFSANRFVGIVSGATVTAVIQSSGASTVMVIGFVNAGLLTLMQAISIIFGANIGTTITAQLVAFDISWIIMPSIILGIILGFVPVKRVSNWSEAVLGLGFLFFGIKFMSDELAAFSTNETFLRIFQTFKCAPIDNVIPLGALLGAIFVGFLGTVLIQSSSAFSGIVIALGMSGLVDIYTAVALILGSNIGSTTTAQLAAIPANTVAKQAAFAHMLFNVLGVVITIATFWITIDGEPIFFKLVDYMSPSGELPRKIANAHTLFNVCTTLILVPFIPLFAKICEKVLPVKLDSLKYKRLEPHLLNTPSIALAQTVSALRKMLKKSWKMADCALRIYNKNDDENKKLVDKLDESEDDIDLRQQDITQYLSKLMQTDLTDEQAGQIPMLLHCTNDAERIGDLTAPIREILERMVKKQYVLSSQAEEEFNEIHEKMAKLADYAIKLLDRKSPELMKGALILRGEIIELLGKIEAGHITRVNEGVCRPEVGIPFLELLETIRKVAKNLFNIIDRVGSFYDRIPKVRRPN